MIAGMYCVTFGLITAVGLSRLQHCNMNSSRNLFIVGFALFNCLSVAGPGGYFKSLGYNPFDTGDKDFDATLLSLFDNPMFIAGLSSVILDNTCPSYGREE